MEQLLGGFADMAANFGGGDVPKMPLAVSNQVDLGTDIVKIGVWIEYVKLYNDVGYSGKTQFFLYIFAYASIAAQVFLSLQLLDGFKTGEVREVEGAEMASWLVVLTLMLFRQLSKLWENTFSVVYLVDHLNHGGKAARHFHLITILIV